MAKGMTRRQWLSAGGGLAAVAVAVPAGFFGCQPAPAAPVTVERNAIWEARAAQLENPGIYTQAAPGMWAGKEANHVPQVAFDAATGSVTVTTSHPMGNDHWITTHYLRNQDGVVIGLKEYLGTDAAAKATFVLPPGTTAVVAYSNCNLHNDWQGASTST